MIIQRLWFSSAKLIESILPIWRGPFLWMHPTLFTTRLLAHSFSRFSTYSRLIACVFIYNLFTQCYTHNSLGWKINVVDRGFKPPIARSDASSLVGFRISSVVFMLVPLAVLFLWCGSVTSCDTQRCFFPYNLCFWFDFSWPINCWCFWNLKPSVDTCSVLAMSERFWEKKITEKKLQSRVLLQMFCVFFYWIEFPIFFFLILTPKLTNMLEGCFKMKLCIWKFLNFKD